MSERGRSIVFIVFGAVFALLLCRAVTGLPSFGGYSGRYGTLVVDTMEKMRQARQGVAAVTFDYRGFDTLGEEFILFAAVAGALLLLRKQETERTVEPTDQADDRPAAATTPAVLGWGVVMFPFTLLLGIYIVLHGHLTPGGGFQGGVLLASGFYFVYLSGEYGDLLDVAASDRVALCEAAGAASFAVIGALSVFAGNAYMLNFLPLGKAGDLLSTGTLPLYNCAVGTEVTAAFLLLISAFLRQVLMIRKGEK